MIPESSPAAALVDTMLLKFVTVLRIQRDQVETPHQPLAPQEDNAAASCVVELPQGTKGGDILTIRWPTKDQFARYQSQENHRVELSMHPGILALASQSKGS